MPDGRGVAAIDITGHELTHGVTQFTSGLNYSSESGAINESMSDIMGKSVQFVAKPTDVNWQLSNDMSWFIRDMSNPNAKLQPDTYNGSYWVNTTNCTPLDVNDYCGVHTNSGVGNYMFYLLMNGGSGRNDIGNSFTVSGIGLDKADMIIYRTNTNYLNPTSKYADWRVACIQAATDLYGASSNEVAQVMNAWYAVGVGTAAPPPSPCSIPTGLSVSNISTGVVTLSWSDVAGARSYRLQLKTTSASSWSDPISASPSYNLTGLTSNTSYQVRVATVCNSSVSDYCPDITFTTSPKSPGSPSIGITVAGGNGKGTTANQLNTPDGVFVDPAGNVYVADANNHRIQKWAPGATAGVTVAGGNGQGSAANQLYYPARIFVTANGTIYISDDFNNRVQKWAPGATSGITVAGGNGIGSAANQLYHALGIFVDAGDNIYIADMGNHRIQKWAPGATAGVTVAGGNGQGSAANQLFLPQGVYVDYAGNIYIADASNSRIQKWAPGATAGVTVAGGNGYGALANQLSSAASVFVDLTGNIYINDGGQGGGSNHRIQKWAPGASAGTTVAGGNEAGAAANQLNFPFDVYLDAAGNIYVADTYNDRIQKFGSNTVSGLTYKYYEGTWSAVPNFSTITPVKTGSSSNIDISVKPANGSLNYGFLWTGNIYIPTPGSYTFETVSDDGSTLSFNPPSVSSGPTVNNDGLHLAKSATGTVTVAAAGLYPITIAYFANGGGDAMQVYWSGPNIPRQLIPNAAFTSNVPADIIAPAAPANLHVTSKGGNFINLDWDNASDNIGVIAYDVYVGGVKTYSTAESQITADNLSLNTSYTFTVKARDLAGNTSGSSNAVTDATTNIQNGLTFKYYEGSWNTLPDFNSLTPVKTGNSLNVDIAVRTAGRNDNFAFVWQGYITITTPGTYTFETVSDDGSKLYFNSLYNPSVTPTVNNDGLHGPVPVTGTVNILAAGTYPICITFFEKDGGEQMQVNWTGPGFAKQPIPNTVLTTTPPASSNGLTYKYYEGTWNALPNFNTLTPVKTGTTANTDISVRTAGRNDNFAFVWQGYINITTPGTYTFETVSDDGSKLYFNSLYDPLATATVNNDGLHAPVPATGTVNIAVAGVYPISITFFEKDGGEQMQVNWTGPGFAKQPIPSSAFTFAPPPPSNGLTYKYYEGSWNALPNFNSLTPVKTGTSDNTDISVRTSGRYDNFAFVWQGYINIPAPGTYTFETVSDDGSKLYFNSLYDPLATATVNNDGLHAPVSATGTVNISAAGVYPIAITFFEKDGGEQMQAYWTGPGFGRQPIPNSAFKAYAPMNVQAAVLPVIPSNKVTTSMFQVDRIYPNPFAESISIDFYNNAAANDVSAGVYDVDGKLVYFYHAGKLAAGNNRLQLDLGGKHLTNGFYFVKMIVNGETVKTLKVVKAR